MTGKKEGNGLSMINENHPFSTSSEERDEGLSIVDLIEAYRTKENLRVKRKLPRSNPWRATGVPSAELCSPEEDTRRKKKPSLKRLTRQQYFALFTLFISQLFSFCSLSVMAPFFPIEAAEKQMSTWVSGLVFSFYAFVVFTVSPIFGKILPFVGVKFLFMAGMFLAGGCNLLFGSLCLMDNWIFFTSYCFILRFFEGIGAGAFSTASFVYVVELFPHNVATVLGLMETAMGLGMSIGPGLGGLLYQVGGFGLPFYILGTLMILVIPSSWIFLPSYASVDEKTPATYGRILKVPAVYVIGLVIVVAANNWSFLDPTLEPHLAKMLTSTYKIGLIFLLFSTCYGISSPLWGWVSDRMGNHWSLMSIGLFMSCFGLLILGPSPIIAQERSLAMDITGLCIIAVSIGLTLMPTFPSILDCAEESGLKRELSTYAIVAGAWSGMYSLGDMIGPTLGGFLADYFGFHVCSTVMAGVSFVTGLIVTIFYTARSKGYFITISEEETPLLPSDNTPVYGGE